MGTTEDEDVVEPVSRRKELICFGDRLRSDRLVEIYVRNDEHDSKEPFRVQQQLLESVSDYFIRALRQDSFKEGREARLDFPDDDIDAWQVLLFWMMYQRVPDIKTDGDYSIIMIRCWVLGDKYNIPKLQDEAMLELLSYYAANRSIIPHIQEAIANSAPSSKLRKLMIEELILDHIGRPNNRIGQNFECLDKFGDLNFMSELMSAYAYWTSAAAKTEAIDRSDDRVSREYDIWREFMVGEWAAGSFPPQLTD